MNLQSQEVGALLSLAVRLGEALARQSYACAVIYDDPGVCTHYSGGVRLVADRATLYRNPRTGALFAICPGCKESLHKQLVEHGAPLEKILLLVPGIIPPPEPLVCA